MSRIGRLPIPVPKGVQVQVSPGLVKVKGPKGELSVPVSPELKVVVEENVVRVERPRSLKHIYAQIIDDEKGETLVAESSLALKLKGNKTEVSRWPLTAAPTSTTAGSRPWPRGPGRGASSSKEEPCPRPILRRR
jgi:hypothetical protein